MDARTTARVVVGAGALLFWLSLYFLAIPLGVPLLDAILLSVLLVALPAFSLAQVPLIEDTPIDRLPAYWGSIASLWFIGSACWLVGTREDGASALGLVPIPFVPLLSWSLGLVVTGLGLILAFRYGGGLFGRVESRLLRELLPRTSSERSVFGLLSVTAGTAEEVAYRGYAIGVLTPLVGLAAAIVWSSAVFGLLHGYQGRAGIARTALMGAVLALGFVVSGSLWPAILAHTAIDIVAGIVLGERLLSPHRVAGV